MSVHARSQRASHLSTISSYSSFRAAWNAARTSCSPASTSHVISTAVPDMSRISRRSLRRARSALPVVGSAAQVP